MRQFLKIQKIGVLVALALAGHAMAEVRMPNVFGDHMVLQRDLNAPVWGWADPGETVTVEFAGQSLSAKADKDGKWRLRLAPLEASAESREFKVSASNTIVLTDVVVGEVWLCGGQSNMESELNWCCPEDGRTADIPLFRIVKADHTLASKPMDDVKTHPWMRCEPERALAICGTGFYFASKMKIEGNRIRVFFEPEGSGLMIGKKDGKNPAVENQGGKLKRFALAGEDKQWHWADAVIDGATVLVSSPEVPNPVAVRYAYSMNPEGCNLYNREGLPASPFRTDDW